MSAKTPSAHSDIRIACYLGLLAWCVYILSAGGHFYSSDDQQKFEALQALIEKGSLHWPGGWGSGLEERRVSWFTWGASLAMLPGYALGSAVTTWWPQASGDDLQRFFISFQNCAVSAGLVSLLYLVARGLKASRRQSSYVALALGFGSIVWPYAKTSWSEPLATLALFGGACALWRQTQAPPSQVTRWALGAGLAFAIAFAVRLEFSLAVLGMLLAAGWLQGAALKRNTGVLVAWLLPLGVVLSLHAWYEWLRYGSLFAFPNYWLPQAHLSGSRLERAFENLYLFVLSPNQGVFWYSPVLVAGFWAWPRFWREAPGLARIYTCGLLPLMLFYIVGWGTSSWAWGLRYAYVLLPFVLLPSVLLLRNVGPFVVHVLFALGVSVQLLAWPFDFGYLYRDALNFAGGETIQLVRLNPEYAPLRLAWRRWPQALQGAQQAWEPRAVPHSITEGLRTARVHFVPDAWWLLYRFTPLPRGPVDAGALILLLMAVWAAVALRRQLLPFSPKQSPPD